MREIAPVMPISDMDRSIAFYTEKLGFVVVYEKQPVFALLRRQGVRIGLQRASRRRPAGTGNCYIWMDHAADTYDALRRDAVTVEDDRDGRAESGLTDFVIYDPDGNHIGLGGEQQTQ